MKIKLNPYISIGLFLNLSLTACVNQTLPPTVSATAIPTNTVIRDDIPVKELTKIEAFTGKKGEIQRIPSILKLKGNQILYFWSGGVEGYDGDLEGAKLYKRILQYNSKGQIIDSGKKELFFSSPDLKGVAKQPMLGRTKDGRIILMFNVRQPSLEKNGYRIYKIMLAFSSDEGKTFTKPIEIPNNPIAKTQSLGTTGTILTLPSGRLVCPVYYINYLSAIGMLYSDNSGVTWKYGQIFKPSYTVPFEPSITLDEHNHIIISSRTSNQAYRELSISTDGGETIQDLNLNKELITPPVAASILYDADNKFFLHSSPTGNARDHYKIQLSFNDTKNWEKSYSPFPPSFYIGYSQIIKLDKNSYAVAVEGLMNKYVLNSSENVGIFIFNKKELFDHISQ